MSSTISETTTDSTVSSKFPELQCDFSQFTSGMDVEEEGLLPGVSYSPNPDYAIRVQKNQSYLHIREKVFVNYIQECDRFRYPLEVAYYAMNYFERYLSAKKVDYLQYQLISILCFKLAVNMFVDSDPFYRMRSIKGYFDQVNENPYVMEADILQTLSWRLNPVTPCQAVYKLLELTSHQADYKDVLRYLNVFCCNIDSLNYTPTQIGIVILCYYYRYKWNEIPFLLYHFSQKINPEIKLLMLYPLNPLIENYTQMYQEVFVDPPVDDSQKYKHLINEGL